MNIREAIAEASIPLIAITPSARLDAELLMAYCLKRPRTFLYSHNEYELTPKQQELWAFLLKQRQASLPIAYLTGEKEFWSLTFKMSIDTLIPRPATESIIEYVLSCYPKDSSLKVCDLGTGSGVIAITLAKERPLWNIIALDIHPGALAMAQYNATQHQCYNIQFICSNWMAKVNHYHFDLIISNPPYIAPQDPHLNQGDVQHEPLRALVSADDGYQDLKLLIQQARQKLNPQGRLICEHGYEQQAKVMTIMHQHDLNVEAHIDHEGIPRFCVGLNEMPT